MHICHLPNWHELSRGGGGDYKEQVKAPASQLVAQDNNPGTGKTAEH